jgi:hypothetical protein
MKERTLRSAVCTLEPYCTLNVVANGYVRALFLALRHLLVGVGAWLSSRSAALLGLACTLAMFMIVVV